MKKSVLIILTILLLFLAVVISYNIYEQTIPHSQDKKIESARVFKDRLSEKLLESAKSFDVQKLKKSGKGYLEI